MSDTRGYYGNVDAVHCQRAGGAWPIAIVVGIAAGVYALSPSARYLYKHGRMPPLPSCSARGRR